MDIILSFHSLRHSHATILLQYYKISTKDVSLRLGHSSETVTITIYAHAIPGNDHLAADAIESDFWSANINKDQDQSKIDTLNDTLSLDLGEEAG